jgi:hypothetical protein
MKTKTFVHIALFWVVTVVLATGTPDHSIKVEERLLGSNTDGFITLRTEVDNLGSYYNSRRKRFLVEYAKLPKDPTSEVSLGAEVKSLLLLDVSTTLNVDQVATNPSTAKSEETIAKNEDVKLAELLLRFPDEAKRWDDEKFRKITYDSTNGPRLDRVGIAWGGWIKERFGGDRNADLDWELREVFEDANCLYLSVYAESYGQRLVSIPPRKTQQVLDHIAKKPMYLIAGKFKTAEEAIKKGRDLMEKTQGKFQSEIWSAGRSKEEMVYVVADSQTEEHINNNAFETLEALMGVDLTVMSSKSFDERTEVAPSK